MPCLYSNENEFYVSNVETLHATSLHQAQKCVTCGLPALPKAAQARGIAAEPPSAKREGDGADSPTRAKSAKPMSEAARPN